MMVVASLFSGADVKNAWRIFRRDRLNHKSPNSAHTEAACAGALHVRLGGDSYYFGELVKKQSIGDDDRAIEIEDITLANKLLFGTTGLCLVLCIFFYLIVKGLILWL